ncbi:MAG: hypothetical protein QF814_08230 [Candidatus Marinimicrobia bacterium]|jgi:hypothetical protein|nr:hypothetical protein [Candidatus Neomarinimicrobiota bacterium]|tara:strand:- start:10781 stop:11509 length:729 start_codon:yes stop_codon:yes gene_type:complete
MTKAEAVQLLLNESSYSIEEIVEKLEVSRFIIHRWKTGISNPRKNNLNKVATLNGYKLEWLNDNEVEIVNNAILDNSIGLLKDNGRYEKIIDNQAELINRLKNENNILNQNVNKFRRSKRILNDHDYSIRCSIQPLEVLEVIGVPEGGLIGYPKRDFIKNTFDWMKTSMFPPKSSNNINNELKLRVALAEELGLAHFDISLNIQFISNEGQSIWAYYVSYYNMEENIVEMFIKFLDSYSLKN